MKVLDIDLDFFINDIANFRSDFGERLSDNEYFPCKEEKVRLFLEHQCGLSINNKIKGRILNHHHEAFFFWRKLIENNQLKTPFDIVHIDAHADLGLGDASWVYIMQNLLHKPLDKRTYPERFKYKSNYHKFSYANYLAFAIGCRWINTLTFVPHPNWENDLPYLIFKDFDEESGFIQLKKYDKSMDLRVDNINRIIPLNIEPEVPFFIIPSEKFKNKQKIDYICLCKSPGFTPKKADDLIPVISNYIDFDYELK